MTQIRPMSERALKEKSKILLKKNGWFSFPIVQTLYSQSGVADRVAVKDGEVVFLEFKSSKGKLSKPQELFARNLISHGGKYFVIRSLQELIDCLHLEVVE